MRGTHGIAASAAVCSDPCGSKPIANARGSHLGCSCEPLPLPLERSWRDMLQQLGQLEAGAADHLAALADQQGCWCLRRRAWQPRPRRPPAAQQHLTVSVASVQALRFVAVVMMRE